MATVGLACCIVNSLEGLAKTPPRELPSSSMVSSSATKCGANKQNIRSKFPSPPGPRWSCPPLPPENIHPTLCGWSSQGWALVWACTMNAHRNKRHLQRAAISHLAVSSSQVFFLCSKSHISFILSSKHIPLTTTGVHQCTLHTVFSPARGGCRIGTSRNAPAHHPTCSQQCEETEPPIDEE